ncbi:phage tail protein [Pseudoalteromonas piscicida]|uniref:Microcystin-dependent protein n=1 Tax=Pseudoalteromonas piscicida TaxID=43662 RepID=A0AAD0RLE0_PSEO7|nr:tail fiber protein [Pseudoalteromonas piscicida]ASD69090.1 microcystin-dependent protein [Pseudoalteromonas piscicida]AXR04546.1 microcystin-dependent protein [Pseudoalteromonas piscicida]
MADCFLGEVRMFVCNFTPEWWASCRGQLLPISQNSALFAVIGCNFGGDCRTTMGVPNLECRVPMGTGTGPGLTPNMLTEQQGDNEVVLYESNLPAHTHTFYGTTSLGGTVDTGQGNLLAQSSGGNVYDKAPDEQNQIAMDYAALGTNGMANAGHENRQPFLAIQFALALDGTFPPRN